MLAGEIFKAGNLVMSSTPLQGDAGTILWGQCLTNRIVIVAAVVLILIDLTDILSIFPALTHTVKNSRGATSLEHSVSVARSRNVAAMLMAIPFCLVCDRYALYPAGFWKMMPFGVSLAVVAGVLFAFLAVRHLIHIALRPRRHDSESSHAIHRLMYTFFILLVMVMLATVAFCCIKNTPQSTLRHVLYWEMAIFYAFAFFREGQILASHSNGFSTILYLCALELIPLGLLIASAVVF